MPSLRAFRFPARAALIPALALLLSVTLVRGAEAQEQCGTTVCGGNTECMSCPGIGQACVVPPAQCCGNAICGGGLVCGTTPQGVQQCQTPLPAAVPPAPRSGPVTQLPQGNYRSRWNQVGGAWSTGWVPNPYQGCGQTPQLGTCACGALNYCGTFPPGTQVLTWPNGCGATPWTLVCLSEPMPAGSDCDLTRPGRWQDRGNTMTTNASGGVLVYGGVTVPFSGTASPTVFEGTYDPVPGNSSFASGGTIKLELNGCELTLTMINKFGGGAAGGLFKP
jgi:hypothetical protein